MNRIASKTEYPDNWPEISLRIRQKAGWKCERCNHVNEPSKGYTLTVHHLDGDKSNSEEWNLAALCQRCHLYMQPVNMNQNLFDFIEVSDWFKPHLEGYRKSKQ